MQLTFYYLASGLALVIVEFRLWSRRSSWWWRLSRPERHALAMVAVIGFIALVAAPSIQDHVWPIRLLVNGIIGVMGGLAIAWTYIHSPE